ncbi:hypothetical protein ARALYDRAFT_892375 [Arabidopsis lyrata subsp. lyrata]|uniref:Uncharacterized protein n=1 Tax=Arabidopsis lyrata subsp. lyrata TaxID=81972 RepID=D7KKH7_ARALL|nr:hypothetical protein ARALYDRAFT_892375 [Arabidopsis lyrata subsp. lyrata]
MKVKSKKKKETLKALKFIKIPSLNSKESFSVSAFASRSTSAVKFQFPVRRVRTGDLMFPSLSSTALIPYQK